MPPYPARVQDSRERTAAAAQAAVMQAAADAADAPEGTEGHMTSAAATDLAMARLKGLAWSQPVVVQVSPTSRPYRWYGFGAAAASRIGLKTSV